MHQLSVHTVGGVIAAAEQIMLIVSDEDRLSVEVKIKPSDFDQLSDIRVNRVSKGRTLFPVRETDVPDLKKGAGQTNSLEVQTVANKATLFVNGTKIAEFNGKPPEGGGLIGLDTYSPKTGGETEARFTNFIVAEPK